MALYYPPLHNGLQKSLAAQLDQGVTTQMTLNNTTGLQNKPGVCVIDRIDSNKNEKDTSVREYVAYSGVSGSNVTGLTRGLGGSTDQDHLIGAVVEFIPDVTVFQAINDTITAEHDTDGTHKAITVSGTITGEDDFIINTNNKSLKIKDNGGNLRETVKVDINNACIVGDSNLGLVKHRSIITATDNSIITFDLSKGQIQQVTLGGNRTLAVSNVLVGDIFIIHLKQDATGGRTVTWWSGISWPDGTAPILTTTANKTDSFGFICIGSNSYYGYIIGQNL